MNARTQASRGANVLFTLLFLPGRLLEEGLHALGAYPFADDISIEIDAKRGTAHTVVRFAESTPRWAIRFAYALPELVASLAGVAVIVFWLLGGSVWFPSTTLDWVLLSLFGAQYLAIALPSSEDLNQTEEAA